MVMGKWNAKHVKLGAEERAIRATRSYDDNRRTGRYGSPTLIEIIAVEIHEAEAALREEMECGHPIACSYEVGDWHPNIGGTDAPEVRCSACDAQAQAVEKARREALELLRGFKGDRQRCNRCGRADGVNFHMENSIWKEVAKEYQDLTLCLSCFDTLAGEKGLKYTMHDLCFAGEHGYSTDDLKAAAVEKAVLEEREACAVEAMDVGTLHDNHTVFSICRQIARAIRRRGAAVETRRLME